MRARFVNVVIELDLNAEFSALHGQLGGVSGPFRRRAYDQVRRQSLFGDNTSHERRRMEPAFIQRTLKICEARIRPTRFSMPEDKKFFHVLTQQFFNQIHWAKVRLGGSISILIIARLFCQNKRIAITPASVCRNDFSYKGLLHFYSVLFSAKYLPVWVAAYGYFSGDCYW